MAILIIDTYDRAIFESLASFTDESLNDRTDFLTLPPAAAALCKQFVEMGAIPTERQPTDSFVVTDDHVILTLTWLDLECATRYQEFKATQTRPGLISSELVET
jgi:hypothetical protein